MSGSANTSTKTSNSNDALLNMFFDEDFVPQAYVDILLSSFQINQLDEIKTTSSSLLSRMDFYSGHVTRELESTIHRLEKPAELILYTPSTDQKGTTKLEYYLDTLANSVSLLEADVKNIEEQLEALNIKYESSNSVTETLSKLMLAKNSLLKVKRSFDTLKTIMEISIQDDQEKLQHITVEEFNLALATLQETITSTLAKPVKEPTELLRKIGDFIELKQMLKGLPKFYVPYSEFAQAIQKERDAYLNSIQSADEL